MLYTYKIWGIRLEFMRKMSHSTWGESEVGAPTIWGADWNYFSIADCVIITLNSSLCCILEVSIVTIFYFQHSCLHKSNQHFKLSYYISSHHFLIGTNNDLSPIINGNKVWFMWRPSLKHFYEISILCSFSVVFVVHQSYCHFFPKIGILFSSWSKWLIIW